jgi:hypothetical protein
MSDDVDIRSKKTTAIAEKSLEFSKRFTQLEGTAKGMSKDDWKVAKKEQKRKDKDWRPRVEDLEKARKKLTGAKREAIEQLTGFTQIRIYFHVLRPEAQGAVIDLRKVKDKTGLWSGSKEFTDQVFATLENPLSYVPLNELPHTLIVLKGDKTYTYDNTRLVLGNDQQGIRYFEIARASPWKADVNVTVDNFKALGIRKRTIDYKQHINIVAEPQRAIEFKDGIDGKSTAVEIDVFLTMTDEVERELSALSAEYRRLEELLAQELPKLQVLTQKLPDEIQATLSILVDKMMRLGPQAGMKFRSQKLEEHLHYAEGMLRDLQELVAQIEKVQLPKDAQERINKDLQEPKREIEELREFLGKVKNNPQSEAQWGKFVLVMTRTYIATYYIIYRLERDTVYAELISHREGIDLTAKRFAKWKNSKEYRIVQEALEKHKMSKNNFIARVDEMLLKFQAWFDEDPELAAAMRALRDSLANSDDVDEGFGGGSPGDGGHSAGGDTPFDPVPPVTPPPTKNVLPPGAVAHGTWDPNVPNPTLTHTVTIQYTPGTFTPTPPTAPAVNVSALRAFAGEVEPLIRGDPALQEAVKIDSIPVTGTHESLQHLQELIKEVWTFTLNYVPLPKPYFQQMTHVNEALQDALELDERNLTANERQQILYTVLFAYSTLIYLDSKYETTLSSLTDARSQAGVAKLNELYEQRVNPAMHELATRSLIFSRVMTILMAIDTELMSILEKLR